MKYAIVIMDGASGLSVAEFDNKTTLEAANTPNLDLLAESGIVGLVHNVPQDLEPSSNVACTSIIGYNPSDFPIGRGAIEGAALGIELLPDQIAFRANQSSAPSGVMKSYSSDNLSTEESLCFTNALKAELDDAVFTLHSGTGFRDILVVNGHPELLEASFTAGHKFPDEDLSNYLPTGPGSELIIQYQEKARDILSKCKENEDRLNNSVPPVTDLWIFWPGSKPQLMDTFLSKYEKTAGMSSGVDLLNGLASMTEIKRYDFEGVTDGPDTDYDSQGRGAIEILNECEVAFIHVEAPDAEGHDGNSEGKKFSIEEIDRAIIGRLIEYSSNHDLRILVLPDHPTPIQTRQHNHDAVPFVISGPGIEPNSGDRMTEEIAANSGILIKDGYKLLGEIFKESQVIADYISPES